MGTFLAVESRTSTLALPARVPLVDNLQQGKKRERATCQTSRHPRRRDGGEGKGNWEKGKKGLWRECTNEKCLLGPNYPGGFVCQISGLLEGRNTMSGQQRALSTQSGAHGLMSQKNAILEDRPARTTSNDKIKVMKILKNKKQQAFPRQNS